ncbi:TPA: hypothetical protein PPH88_004974 [Escherichia coli]|nr:hypothetical protein [Escherichia coli]EKD2721783.1 hypothetical protein [Escherichia coli]EME2636418.1 hypothetical protein [Escherichia coli]KYS90369.1 hypothetical protein AML35_19250 [Escherichia coli]MBS8961878.1 hypothetical protein [Escherichia coli]
MLGGMSDTSSNRITFERDSQYRITGVSHTDGIRLKLTYHASGYLKAIHRTGNGIQTQGKIIRSTLFVLNNSHFMFKN